MGAKKETSQETTGHQIGLNLVQMNTTRAMTNKTPKLGVADFNISRSTRELRWCVMAPVIMGFSQS